jgi:hypothetical protein
MRRRRANPLKKFCNSQPVLWARLPAEAVGVVRRKVSKDAKTVIETTAKNRKIAK